MDFWCCAVYVTGVRVFVAGIGLCALFVAGTVGIVGLVGIVGIVVASIVRMVLLLAGTVLWVWCGVWWGALLCGCVGCVVMFIVVVLSSSR